MNQTKEAIRFGPHLRYLEMEVNGMQEHEDLTEIVESQHGKDFDRN